MYCFIKIVIFIFLPGVEKDSMVVLEYCPHGNLLSFIKSRRQMFKPIWSKQHLGMEKEFTMFDLCVAGYQIAKGLEFLAARKVCCNRFYSFWPYSAVVVEVTAK